MIGHSPQLWPIRFPRRIVPMTDFQTFFSTPAAALFDLDGVIIDTEPQYTTFWEVIGKDFCPALPNFASLVKGQTLKYIFATYFPDKALQQRVHAALFEFERTMNYPYIAGAMAFIKRLNARNIPAAIVTSSAAEKMENLYRAHPDFTSHFAAILTAEDCRRSKPAPDCYLTAAERLRVPIERCVIFEDSFNGLASARAAGGRVVALATTNPPEVLSDKADCVIKDFTVL